MHVVLIEPEIPPNTGNIARLCAATKTPLHLIEPLGFQMNDKRLQRAGMDYWQQVSWHRWDNWQAFHTTHGGRGRFWLIESAGAKHYAEVQYAAEDFLLFGRESAGLPPKLLEQYPDCCLRIPMFHPASRSLNLANCAAIVLYEALRQQGFPSECAFPPASTVG